jgi:hypothetical protein
MRFQLYKQISEGDRTHFSSKELWRTQDAEMARPTQVPFRFAPTTGGPPR